MNDKAYRKWIQTLPSAISGKFSEYVDGQGRNPACHVRRIKWGAGIGIKPDFCYIPLTQTEHLLQHWHGETHFHPVEWWEEQVMKYQKLYLEQDD